MLVHSKDGVDVTIGKENSFENMQDCSLVTATYQLNGCVVGKIGIIGPTRMDYANIVSIADYVTKDSNGSFGEVQRQIAKEVCIVNG